MSGTIFEQARQANLQKQQEAKQKQKELLKSVDSGLNELLKVFEDEIKNNQQFVNSIADQILQDSTSDPVVVLLNIQYTLIINAFVSNIVSFGYTKTNETMLDPITLSESNFLSNQDNKIVCLLSQIIDANLKLQNKPTVIYDEYSFGKKITDNVLKLAWLSVNVRRDRQLSIKSFKETLPCKITLSVTISEYKQQRNCIII